MSSEKLGRRSQATEKRGKTFKEAKEKKGRCSELKGERALDKGLAEREDLKGLTLGPKEEAIMCRVDSTAAKKKTRKSYGGGNPTSARATRREGH